MIDYENKKISYDDIFPIDKKEYEIEPDRIVLSLAQYKRYKRITEDIIEDSYPLIIKKLLLSIFLIKSELIEAYELKKKEETRKMMDMIFRGKY